MAAAAHWAVILGGSSGFGLASARRLAAAGMSLCLVHRDRRSLLAGITPEFEKLRASGVEVRTHNVDALSTAKRAVVLDDLAGVLGGGGRVRLLLHSIAFGHLKPLAPEPAGRAGGNGAAEALAQRLGIEAETLRAAADELLEDGVDAVEGLASPAVHPQQLLDADDVAHTIHCMGTSLLEWTQDLRARGLFASDARVLGLTSEGSAVAWRSYAAVAAAKAALEALARCLALEMAPHGIRCNVLQPGVTETPALAAIPGSARLKARARLRNPFGRLTTPEDVAGVVHLLCSDEAGWINGEVIRVDGGEHISGSFVSERPFALVTGGARGIGAACCRALSAEGFRLGIHHRSSAPEAAKLSAELDDALLLRADLTLPDEIDALVAELKDGPGRVDVLVNNAGVVGNAPMPMMKLDDYDAVAGLTRGAWYLTKLLLRRFMLRQERGCIINISSVVGHTGNRGQSAYAMAKAGLDAMTRSLSLELAGRPIRVNSVAPGFVETDMTADLPEAARRDILGRIPLGRMGTPQEVADAVAWLATRASYVNGAVIHVNGGLYGG